MEEQMLQVAIGLYGMHQWFDGDFAPIPELVRRAEDAGVDQVSITDHVVMGEHIEKYPYGPFPAPLDYPWFEPITVLAAIAAVTRRIRLSTGIVIAPLRSAVLLAKQIATLDVLSRGRVTIGLGLGWQKEEYDASGVPWEGRYARFDEQIRVCKLLWSVAPVSFTGSTVSLERIHQWPRPVQPALPIWLGIAPTPRNIERIAEYGNGWIPMEQRPEQLAVHIAAIRKAFVARGRDPAELAVRAVPRMVFGASGLADLEAAADVIPALVAAGVTTVELFPAMYCRGPQEFDAFCARLAGLKKLGGLAP
jgi:probable F420-dependent oxidoreductase